MELKPNAETQSLINVVNRFFPGKVTVQLVGHMQSGYVRHDQAQTVQDGKNIMIQIRDLTAPNYTATHELLHLLMVLRGFPQVYFSLTTGRPQLDVQLKAMGMELYDIVAHFVVVAEQRKHHLITPEIEKMYLKGIYATINPEPSGNKLDNEMEVRLSTLLDAMIFYGSHFKQVASQFNRDFPKSMAGARKLYRIITAKPTDSPFGMRRNVVKLFKAYDDQLKQWNLPPLQNLAFTTLSSVFSEHQLRLQVGQLFTIYRSELRTAKNRRQAYVGFSKVDHQNSFVIPGPFNRNQSAQFLNRLNHKSVHDLFKKLKMPFIIR